MDGLAQEEIAFDSAFSKLRMTGTGAQDPVPEVARYTRLFRVETSFAP